ncbi:unnamed protein product, partial [Ectocarpus sp. 12 AP-2014]
YRKRRDFARNAADSWRVVDTDEELVLCHEVKRRKGYKGTPERLRPYGWKIVPRKEFVPDMCAQIHQEFHGGRERARQMANLRYIIPRPILDDFLKRARASCHECVHKNQFPKKPPDTPIISSSFGERILVDLKTLPKYGYMIVAVCHWSGYCWLGHLATKAGDGVAKFLGEVVFPDIDQIRDSWKTTHEESQAARIGGLSFPNPYSDLVDTGVGDAVTNLHVMGGIQDHEVQRDLATGLKTGRTQVLQHDRGKEFDNKLVKRLCAENDRVVVMSKPYSPRENGRVENKVKHASAQLNHHLGLFQGIENCSRSELIRAIASSQAVENHSLHSRTRYTPYMAAYRRRSTANWVYPGTTYLTKGEVLTELEVVSMLHRIQFRQVDKAISVVTGSEKQTQVHENRKGEFRVGMEVVYKHPAHPFRLPNRGRLKGTITHIIDEEGKPFRLRVLPKESGKKAALTLGMHDVHLPSNDPEMGPLLTGYAALKSEAGRVKHFLHPEAKPQESKDSPTPSTPCSYGPCKTFDVEGIVV